MCELVDGWWDSEKQAGVLQVESSSAVGGQWSRLKIEETYQLVETTTSC